MTKCVRISHGGLARRVTRGRLQRGRQAGAANRAQNPPAAWAVGRAEAMLAAVIAEYGSGDSDGTHAKAKTVTPLDHWSTAVAVGRAALWISEHLPFSGGFEVLDPVAIRAALRRRIEYGDITRADICAFRLDFAHPFVMQCLDAGIEVRVVMPSDDSPFQDRSSVDRNLRQIGQDWTQPEGTPIPRCSEPPNYPPLRAGPTPKVAVARLAYVLGARCSVRGEEPRASLSRATEARQLRGPVPICERVV